MNKVIDPPTLDNLEYVIENILLLSLFVLPELLKANDVLTPLLPASVLEIATEPDLVEIQYLLQY